jgi:hypothetical protein
VEVSRMTYKSVARGKTIELDEPLPVPDGQAVTVSIGLTPAAHAPGSPAAILEALAQLPHIDPEAVDELERAIQDTKRPASYEGVFDEECQQ